MVSLLSFLLRSTVTVKPKCVAHSTMENNGSLRWFPSHKIFLLWLLGFKTYLVRRRTKTQKYKGAVFEQLGERLGLARSVENETKQKTRQQNKTQGSKQGKQIINQNVRVLTPLFIQHFNANALYVTV